MNYILADRNPSQFDFDLGFGSRLFAWAQASYCAHMYGYTVVIPDDEWAEEIFLHLPNTIVMKRCDIENISWNILYCEGKHILNENYWKITGMCTIPQSITMLNDPLWSIKFKFEKLNKFFDNKFDNFVGFHLRRWFGVPVKDEDMNDILKTLPTAKIRLRYYKMWTECGPSKQTFDTDPPWIPDSVYYNVLNKIKCNIYLSTDVPKDLCYYYKIKYPNIVDMDDYIQEWEDLLSEEYDLNIVTNLANATLRTISHDLLDMFALSKCKQFILSADSQWGLSAIRLNNRKNMMRKFYTIGIPGIMHNVPA